MKFWDYGNSFLYMASIAGADIASGKQLGAKNMFRYPSYVEDIMGDIFELGFGPFRWICTSGLDEDLKQTDKIA
jgi:urocanate hydratase